MTAKSNEPTARLSVELSHDRLHRLRLAAADQEVEESTIVSRALDLWLAHNLPPADARPAADADDTLRPEEAVKQAKGLRRRGLSWPRIAEILNREGFVTTRGRPWSRSSVARAVKKPS